MSMTNEGQNAEWEIGDAITVRLEPEEPSTHDGEAGEDVDDDA